MFQISKVTRTTLMAALALVWISTGAAMAQDTGTTTPAPQPVVIVDINSAPVAQLQGVVMNDVLARRIVESRPFANKRQLLTRNLVSLEEYDKIKDMIIARRVVTPDPQ
jgi:DNA uptake protein ComE-like DNA-binding protein